MTRAQLLAYLAEHGPATVADISRGLATPRQSVSSMLHTLRNREWVCFVGDPVFVPHSGCTGGSYAIRWGLTDRGRGADEAAVPTEPAEYGDGGILERALRNRCALALAWAEIRA